MISYIDTDNDVAYGISCRGKQVMIVNEWEIFHLKKFGEIIIIPYHGTVKLKIIVRGH
jgi:hypothetical protein